MIDWGMSDVAETLGIPKENVRLVSPFIGGGFGGKLFVRCRCGPRRPWRARCSAAGQGGAAAARIMINNTTHRPATIQRIRSRDRGRQDHCDRA